MCALGEDARHGGERAEAGCADDGRGGTGRVGEQAERERSRDIDEQRAARPECGACAPAQDGADGSGEGETDCRDKHRHGCLPHATAIVRAVTAVLAGSRP